MEGKWGSKFELLGLVAVPSLLKSRCIVNVSVYIRPNNHPLGSWDALGVFEPTACKGKTNFLLILGFLATTRRQSDLTHHYSFEHVQRIHMRLEKLKQ